MAGLTEWMEERGFTPRRPSLSSILTARPDIAEQLVAAKAMKYPARGMVDWLREEHAVETTRTSLLKWLAEQ